MKFKKLRHFQLHENPETTNTGLPLPIGALFFIEPVYEYRSSVVEDERRFAAYIEKLRGFMFGMIREEVKKMLTEVLTASCDKPEQLARIAESVGYPIVEGE